MIYRAAMLGAAGGAFSPDDIAGLQLWLDASDTSTITESSGAVSQWDDKSGNSRHVAQGTAANQPATGAATINSKNVIRFDGLDDILQAVTSLGTASEFTWTVVAKFRATGGTETLLAASNGAYASGNEWALVRQISGAYGGAVNGDSTAQDGSQAGTVDTSPHVMTIRYNKPGDEFALFLDGTQLWIDEALTSSEPDLTANIDVGALDNGGSIVGAGEVDVAEIVMYNSDLAMADRDAVEAYLAAKWGVTLS